MGPRLHIFSTYRDDASQSKGPILQGEGEATPQLDASRIGTASVGS